MGILRQEFLATIEDDRALPVQLTALTQQRAELTAALMQVDSRLRDNMKGATQDTIVDATVTCPERNGSWTGAKQGTARVKGGSRERGFRAAIVAPALDQVAKGAERAFKKKRLRQRRQTGGLGVISAKVVDNDLPADFTTLADVRLGQKRLEDQGVYDEEKASQGVVAQQLRHEEDALVERYRPLVAELNVEAAQRASASSAGSDEEIAFKSDRRDGRKYDALGRK